MTSIIIKFMTSISAIDHARKPSPFPLFTNSSMINGVIFGQGVVIYYVCLHLSSLYDCLQGI